MDTYFGVCTTCYEREIETCEVDNIKLKLLFVMLKEICAHFLTLYIKPLHLFQSSIPLNLS